MKPKKSPEFPNFGNEEKKRRRDRIMLSLPELLGSFEDRYPNWKEAIMISLLDSYLAALKKLIENPEVFDISWGNPFAEFHFDISYTGDMESGFSAQFGTIDYSEIDNEDSEVSAVSVILLKALQITFLQDLMQVATIETNDGILPLLSQEMAEAIFSIENEEQRENALDSLLRPCSFGAGTIDWDLDDECEVDVGESTCAQLAQIRDPLISVPIEVNGLKMRVISIFEIQVPIIDPDSKKGYYPIIAGVSLQMVDENPPEGWHGEEWADLGNWPLKDIETVWAHLVSGLNSVFSELGFGSKKDYEEVMVTLRASVRVAPGADVQQAIAEAQKSISKIGHVESMVTTVEVGAPQLGIDRTNGWMGLFEAVENASDNFEKGASLERLLADLFNSIPGFEAKSNVRTKTEEVDIWITNLALDPPFSKEGMVILAECKNWGKKAGKDEFVLFQEKMKNRGTRCSIGFLVSWSGFAKTISQERLRSSKSEPLVALLDKNNIENAIRRGEFLSVITEAMHCALSQ